MHSLVGRNDLADGWRCVAAQSLVLARPSALAPASCSPQIHGGLTQKRLAKKSFGRNSTRNKNASSLKIVLALLAQPAPPHS